MTFDFEKDVLERSCTIPVIVEFGQSNCGPCYFMEKVLIDAVKISGKVELISLSIEQYANLTKTYNLLKNPTTILFKNKKEIARLKGAYPLIVVEQWINDNI